MDRDDLNTKLKSMSNSLTRQAYPELKFQIEFYGPLFYASCDITLIRKFELICLQAKNGFEFEEKHGRWSLLKLDHPVTIELKKMGFYKRLPH